MEDGEGRLLNIEIQRVDTVDHARRTSFYSSMIDSEYLQKRKTADPEDMNQRDLSKRIHHLKCEEGDLEKK